MQALTVRGIEALKPQALCGSTAMLDRVDRVPSTATNEDENPNVRRLAHRQARRGTPATLAPG
jgi:hypothetical protein